MDRHYPACPIYQAKEKLTRHLVEDAGSNGWLTINQTAEVLDVEVETVQHWVQLGQLPGARRLSPKSEPVIPVRVVDMLTPAEMLLN